MLHSHFPQITLNRLTETRPYKIQFTALNLNQSALNSNPISDYQQLRLISMASSNFMVFMAIFTIVTPLLALGDAGNICDDVVCGKGTCKTGTSVAPYGFICECDNGWRRTRLNDTDELYLKFLPCVIPNCTMNYSCMPEVPALPPVSPDTTWNKSYYDPCSWIYCGEGTCTNTSAHIHTCQCQPGAYNLLNISQFPCYSDCAIGSDCSSLGIKVSGKSTAGSSSSSSQDSGSQSHGNISWIILLTMAASGAFFLWM